MKLKRQSKMRVLTVSVFFSWSSIILPGLARHALAEDQPAQSEQVIEVLTTNTDVQVPADQQVKSEEVTEQPQAPIVAEDAKDQAQVSTEAPASSGDTPYCSSVLSSSAEAGCTHTVGQVVVRVIAVIIIASVLLIGLGGMRM